MREWFRDSWAVLLSPLSGAVLLGGGFALAVRPHLTSSAWVLDALTVALSALGVLLGGVLGAPVWSVHAPRLSSTSILVTFGTIAAVVTPILFFAGTPLPPLGVVALGLASAVLLTPSVCRRAAERR
jgi:hypothetical protein